jgi:hypothetical protein
VFCVTISTVAFDSELPLTRRRAIRSRQLLDGVTTVLGFTISRDKRYRVYGLSSSFPICALFDV